MSALCPGVSLCCRPFSRNDHSLSLKAALPLPVLLFCCCIVFTLLLVTVLVLAVVATEIGA